MNFGRQYIASSGLAQAGQLAINPERTKRQNYLNELQEQIRLKEYRKKMEKLREEQENLKVQKEQQEYQYFGRAGAGGVRRDIFGNIITSKKFDPNFISNLYAREEYNRKLLKQVEVQPVYSPPVIINPISQVKEKRIDFHEQHEQHLELQKRIEEERMRRELMEKQLEEEKSKREEQEIKLRRMEEEEIRRQQEFNEAMLLKSKEVKDKVNVRLQADIEQEEIKEQEFIITLPNKVQSHLTSIVDNELNKLVVEMKQEENQIVNSIMRLKVTLSYIL
jgi:hypothetical protein